MMDIHEFKYHIYIEGVNEGLRHLKNKDLRDLNEIQRDVYNKLFSKRLNEKRLEGYLSDKRERNNTIQKLRKELLELLRLNELEFVPNVQLPPTGIVSFIDNTFHLKGGMHCAGVYINANVLYYVILPPYVLKFDPNGLEDIIQIKIDHESEEFEIYKKMFQIENKEMPKEAHPHVYTDTDRFCGNPQNNLKMIEYFYSGNFAAIEELLKLSLKVVTLNDNNGNSAPKYITAGEQIDIEELIKYINNYDTIHNEQIAGPTSQNDAAADGDIVAYNSRESY